MDGLRAFLSERDLNGAELFPMVRGRLTAINGRTVGPDDYDNPRAKRLVEREFNLSWADRLQEDNRILAGRWWNAGERGQGIASVEVGLAKDLGIALNDTAFKGVQRDGIPVGDRIFRMAYFDPQGRMTIQQWNTKSQGTDYRLGPRETKLETCTFRLPDGVALGELTVTAVLNYQKLVKPVADFLGVPPDEAAVVEVNRHATTVTVVDDAP